MDFITKQLKNVTIAGHGQAGKTRLTEQLLYVAGVITKPESVESGKTVSDYTAEEIERHISIYASLSHLVWKDKKLNFWDAPGSSDFVGEVISAFRSSEMALMLLDGRNGVQIETIKLWRDLDRRNKPRLVFINRLEEERSIAETIPQDLREKFSCEPCSVSIPMGKGDSYEGVIDVIKGKAFFVPADGEKEKEADIPEKYMAAFEEARGILAGAAAEGDDDLFVKFIDEGELTQEEIIHGLTIALENNRIVPVLQGAL